MNKYDKYLNKRENMFIVLQLMYLFRQLFPYLEMPKETLSHSLLIFYDQLLNTPMNQTNSFILDCEICLYFQIHFITYT